MRHHPIYAASVLLHDDDDDDDDVLLRCVAFFLVRMCMYVLSSKSSHKHCHFVFHNTQTSASFTLIKEYSSGLASGVSAMDLSTSAAVGGAEHKQKKKSKKSFYSKPTPRMPEMEILELDVRRLAQRIIAHAHTQTHTPLCSHTQAKQTKHARIKTYRLTMCNFCSRTRTCPWRMRCVAS
jgi:hypothetical protein